MYTDRLIMAAEALEDWHKRNTGIRGFFRKLIERDRFINFNLESWVKNKNQAKKSGHSCGTAACALGYIAGLREFNDLGLCLSSKWPVYYRYAAIRSGYMAAACFFGISHSTATHLFMRREYPDNPTALDVAKRIRNLVRTGENHD